MSKTLTLLIALFLCCANIARSEEGLPPEKEKHEARPARPSTYELVDEVRNAIGLDHKEFDKVYSAYDKYTKKVFGDNKKFGNQMPGGRPSGGPGRGMRPRGGMGGPGGGMGPRGGMGGPGGPRHEGDRPNNQEKKPVDIEKLEKNKAKAEENLCKSIKKVFKNDENKYNRWLEIRSAQLERIFPRPPRPTTQQ